MARSATLRIDSRADQHQRSNTVRPTHGELRDDLATHRVRHERGTLEAGGVQPAGEGGGELGNAERRGRPLAPPVPGQVRCEHCEGRGERLREREHVRARDAVPVQEDDRRALPDHARMDVQSGYVERPALDFHPANETSRGGPQRHPRGVMPIQRCVD